MTGLDILFMLTTIQLGLPADLLKSVCYTETKLNIVAIHHNDGRSSSIGLCQIKLSSAKQMGFKGTEKKLFEPSNNIYYAGKYLNYQLKRYHGNIKKSIIAYNYGHAGCLTFTKYQYKVFKYWRGEIKYEF